MEETHQKPHFSSIIISGGAMKMLSTIGCIQYLEENNLIKDIRNMVGTSAGSVICLFLILGYRHDEIKNFIIKNFSDPEIVSFDLNKALGILTEYGISDGSNLCEFLRRVIHKKLKVDDITFLELAKIVGKNLVVCVSNLTDEKEEFMSVDTYPNLSIIKAIRASCGIPYMFTPIEINDKLYIDGALYNNFAIDYFKNNMLRDILGLNIIKINSSDNNNLISYTLNIVYSLVNKVNKKTYDCHEKNIVSLDIEDNEWFSLESFQISISPELIQTYIDTGYKLIKDKLRL